MGEQIQSKAIIIIRLARDEPDNMLGNQMLPATRFLAVFAMERMPFGATGILSLIGTLA